MMMSGAMAACQSECAINADTNTATAMPGLLPGAGIDRELAVVSTTVAHTNAKAFAPSGREAESPGARFADRSVQLLNSVFRI